VRDLHLMQSELTSAGSRYTRLETIPLQA
jgi:hypothetical protein